MMQYRLAKGVDFQELDDSVAGKKEGLLAIRYPQRIIRLSSSGVEALKTLCGQRAGVAAGVMDARLRDFADNLENQGVLQRHFSNLTPAQLQSVSIIIPTYNRKTMLGSCLQSLIDLNYPKEKIEIIVVDDCSPEPVEIGNLPMVKLIRMPQNSGPGAARNEAVRQAKGEIIAFLDDDCLADKDWLQALVPCFQEPDVAGAGGRVESAVLDISLDKYEQVQSPLLMGDNQRRVRKGSAVSYLATCNLLVRKESFLAAGGFDPELRVGEDVDLCWRLLLKGQRIYYMPGGLVYHHHRSRLIQFLTRRYNYGQSEAKLQKRYPGERRRLFLMEGNLLISAIALAVLFTAGLVTAIMTKLGLLVLNLFWQSIRKQKSLKRIDQKTDFRSIVYAQLRVQGTAIYYFCQHFARYYSLPVITAALVGIPGSAFGFAAIHLLSSVVSYKIKKPALKFGRFIFFNSLENLFYQMGVYSGCLTERNWRPLTMSFARSGKP